VAEAAAAILAVQGVDDLPRDLLDPLDHQLGQPFTARDDKSMVRVRVQQDHLHLTAVRRIDQAWRVGHGQAVVQRVTAARQHETRVAHGDGDRDAGWHQEPSATGRHDAVLTGTQVETGIARVGVRGKREVEVESNDRHGEHNLRLCHTQAPDGYAPEMVTPPRPPSVDALAREMTTAGLPHAVCVELARQAVAEGPAGFELGAAMTRANLFAQSLLGPVINATGVLLHTNLGRAPVEMVHAPTPMNIELDLHTGERGSRQHAVGTLLAMLCGAEASIVVNNNAAAVMLALATIARDRQVLVSRGESVEIGGGFRIPEVIEQSGARLVDVGTTNRTRPADYRKALGRKGADVAAILKVHPSNYRVEGFVETTSIADIATLGVPVIADIGSGLIDANCPWLGGPPPAWLRDEPAVRQTLDGGAALVTFSGDKLFGGPQAGIIVGKADLVRQCEQHPLMRALRPGAHVMAAMQRSTLAYLDKRATTDIPFWAMVATTIEDLQMRAGAIIAAAGVGAVEETEAVPGGGSAPGRTIPSIGIRIDGDCLALLRSCDPPVVARTRDGSTLLDLRTVEPGSDGAVAAALRRCA
jgi:L-seryl-tRNA(Ser) seleniumtransferase